MPPDPLEREPQAHPDCQTALLVQRLGFTALTRSARMFRR
jgi:hypothetical protein